MFLTETDSGPLVAESADGPGSSAVAAALRAAFRVVVVTCSALALTCGLGVVIWAVTPSSGAGPAALVRAGVAALAAANGMSLSIGRAVLTLPPLLVTAVVIALLTTVSGRGRVIPRGRRQELLVVSVSALVYATAVTVAAVIFGGPGVVRPDQWWRPALLALLVVGGCTLLRGDGWRTHLEAMLPPWVPTAVRLAGVGVAILLAGGAITVAIGLVRSLGESASVQNLAAPGAAGGLGMALLGLAFLPNAVLAGIGYSTGVGFTIGNGTYSMFGSSPVELPPITLLTAAPDGSSFSRWGSLLLLFPVLAGVVMGRAAVRRVGFRRDRIRTVLAGAALAAVLLAAAAAGGSGGVTGGEWSTSGAPPLLLAGAVALILGTVGAGVVLLAGAGEVGAQASGQVEDSAGAPVGDDAAAVVEAGTDEPGAVDDTPDAPDDAGSETAEQDTSEAIDGESIEHGTVPDEAAEDGTAEDGTAEDSTGEDEAGDLLPDGQGGDQVEADVMVEAEVMADGEAQPTGQPAADSVGVRGREEDLIAAAASDDDAQLVAEVSRKKPARRVG